MSATEVNGALQGTIFKKCDRSDHHPENRKACANDTCKHTCEPGEIEGCRHAWTLRYSVQGIQREQSYRDSVDAATGKVKPGSGLKKAQDAQLKLTHDKRKEGESFTDPARGKELFTEHAAAWVMTTARLKASRETREGYRAKIRGDISKAFGGWTLSQMCTEEAATRLGELVNEIMAHRSPNGRRIALMLVRDAMDGAVHQDKVGRHKLQEVTVDPKRGTWVPRREQIAAQADDDEGAGQGFIFVSDAQVALLADGCPSAATGRTLKGVGLAAWLQRVCGARIREALGADKADFRTRKDSSHYWRLREQATEKGTGRENLKHRAKGEGRDIDVPEFLWQMIQAAPEGPLCPGPRGTRYLPYQTAAQRYGRLSSALGLPGFTSHSLRHQFASEMLETVGLRNIAALAWTLGHKSPETTLRVYVHASADATAMIAAAMSDRWDSPKA